MDEIKLKDDLMARLARELERPVLQVIDGALSAVLRDYDVSKRETGLSTEVVSWPEYDIFMSRMIFGGYSKSTIRQYGTFLRELLVYVGKPVQEITGDDIVSCLNAYAEARQISGSTKDHKRLICSSFFTFLHDRGYISRNPMATIDPIKYVAEVREALNSREVEKMRIACGENIRDNLVLELFLATGCRVSEVVGMRVEEKGLIYNLELSQITPTNTNETQISSSINIPTGNYLVILNAIARSSANAYTSLTAKFNGNAFLLGRIPNTNGMHMNVCMNIAVALPASDITFTIQRLDATGEVVFFGGTLFLIRL